MENVDESDSLPVKHKRLLPKKKRRRTIINSRDLEKLESLFKTSKWPDRHQKGRLSKAIGKSENFISTWFQNRRARMRRLARQKDLLDDVDSSGTNLDNNPNEEDISVTKLHKYRSRTRRHSMPPIHLLDLEKPECPDAFEDQHDYSTSSADEINVCGGDLPESGRYNASKIPKEGKIETNSAMKVTVPVTGRAQQTVMTKDPSDVIPSEKRVLVETPSLCNPSDTTSWENVFRRIIDMMSASESVMSKSDPSFPFAVKDAALGIRLDDGKIYYNKEYGLDFEDSD